mmetsp:Transcript_43880/g.114435  ORF Transcript_43880/g.114435 Transcript_43880/m.114435 type:complete len:96 (+) Transcript_43880:222-509(+)
MDGELLNEMQSDLMDTRRQLAVVNSRLQQADQNKRKSRLLMMELDQLSDTTKVMKTFGTSFLVFFNRLFNLIASFSRQGVSAQVEHIFYYLNARY